MAAKRRLRGTPSQTAARRAADRHYLRVFAAETRRLARQLRAPDTGRASENRMIAEPENPEVPR